MKKNLYWLHDNKSGDNYYCFFSVNDEVAIRDLSGDLKVMVSRQAYATIAQWGDSDLYCIDISKKSSSPVLVKEFRTLFAKPAKKEEK